MGFYVYITEDCEEAAKKHGCWQDIRRFRDKVLADQNTIRFEYFPPPFLKKRFRKQHRLVAAERQLEEETVIIFHRLMIRGNAQYNDFISDPRDYGRRFLTPKVTDDQLRQWLKAQQQTEKAAPKPAPSEAEQRYLWDIAAENTDQNNDKFIFESLDWIEQLEEDKRQHLLKPIRRVLASEVDKQTPFATKTVQLPEHGGITLVGRYFPNAKWLFLAGIEEPAEDASGLTSRYRQLLFEEEEEIEREVLLRNSAKSYPDYLLADENTWVNIERNAASNLALSPEETGLLRSVHDLQDQQARATGFPLFINGRAGSGKSTILQYLFADYLAAHLRFAEPGIAPPIYLTYSQELVNKSQSVVKGLLKYSVRYLEDNLLEGEPEAILDKSFQEFHSFLRGLLDEEGEERFPPDRFVDYRKFSQLWSTSLGINASNGKGYGPELSWHVIRTYIKGMSATDELDVEDYKELPAGERSVPDQQFQDVYERVYRNWYTERCKEEGYWDAQDLIRYLLQQERIPAHYPAVFCDEAQDFTRIELEALLRLNLFSARTLTPQELERVPFAFAGDPLQTINPTGFRWEGIKTAFVQKFVRTLAPYSQAGHENKMNYRELRFNYRSSKHIIKLNNSIQALRTLLFEDYKVKPQQTWREEEQSNLPAYFPVTDEAVAHHIRRELDLMIIVPCSVGEEQEFVAQDPYLSQWVDRDSKGIPRNVHSPARAKGLEFERVVIYGFGAYLPTQPLDKLQLHEGWRRPGFDVEQKLAYEYFLNRLYVAASRPQQQLIVIDTTEGLQRLWGFALQSQQQGALLGLLKNADATWSGHLGSLAPGNKDTWAQTQADPALLARRLEAKGKEGDPVLLRQAAMIWKQVEKPQYAARCLGRALLQEEAYREAGEHLIEAHLHIEALQAFWQSGAYERIVALPEEAKQDAPLQMSVARLLTSTSAEGRMYVEVLAQLKSAFERGAWTSNWRNSKAWRIALQAILERLNEKAGEVDIDTVLGKQLHSLYHRGLPLPSLPFFRFLAKAQLLEEARGLYHSLEPPLPADVRDAYAQMLLNTKADTLSAEEALLLSRHYQQEKNFEQAANLLLEQGSPQQYASMVKAELAYYDDVSPSCALHLKALLEKQCRAGQWQQAIALCFEGTFGELKGQHKEQVKQYIRDQERVFITTFLQEVATSPTLPERPKSQKQVSAVLSRLEKTRRSALDYLHPIVLGAAYERAGNYLYTVKYYDKALQDKQLPDREKQLLRERLVASRWKRAAFLQAQEGEQERAANYREKTLEKAQKWKVEQPPDNLPPYPIVNEWLLAPAFEEPATPEPAEEQAEAEPVSAGKPAAKDQASGPQEWPEREHIQIGELSIVGSRQQRKLKIRHRDGLDDATVQWVKGSLQVRSVDVQVEELAPQVYWIPAWALRLKLKKGLLLLHFEQRGTQLRLKGFTD